MPPGQPAQGLAPFSTFDSIPPPPPTSTIQLLAVPPPPTFPAQPAFLPTQSLFPNNPVAQSSSMTPSLIAPSPPTSNISFPTAPLVPPPPPQPIIVPPSQPISPLGMFDAFPSAPAQEAKTAPAMLVPPPPPPLQVPTIQKQPETAMFDANYIPFTAKPELQPNFSILNTIPAPPSTYTSQTPFSPSGFNPQPTSMVSGQPFIQTNTSFDIFSSTPTASNANQPALGLAGNLVVPPPPPQVSASPSSGQSAVVSSQLPLATTASVPSQPPANNANVQQISHPSTPASSLQDSHAILKDTSSLLPPTVPAMKQEPLPVQALDTQTGL